MDTKQIKALSDEALDKKIADLGVVAAERDARGGLTERGCAAVKERIAYLDESERRQRERDKQKQADDARAIAERIEADKQRLKTLRTLGVQSL